jgi:hypothetical protein
MTFLRGDFTLAHRALSACASVAAAAPPSAGDNELLLPLETSGAFPAGALEDLAVRRNWGRAWQIILLSMSQDAS